MTRTRPTSLLLVAVFAAVAAVVMALAAGATGGYAAGKANGNALIKKHTLSANRLKPDTVTGTQVAESSLAKVPSAATADHAAVADRAPVPVLHAYAYGPSWGPEPSLARAEGYRIDASGFVHLQGTVSRPTGVSTLIAVLPPGYRPASFLSFPILTSGGAGYIGITTAGEIALSAGNTLAVSLEGVIFYPDV